jgi:hypothetical protein
MMLKVYFIILRKFNKSYHKNREICRPLSGRKIPKCISFEGHGRNKFSEKIRNWGTNRVDTINGDADLSRDLTHNFTAYFHMKILPRIFHESSWAHFHFRHSST